MTYVLFQVVRLPISHTMVHVGSNIRDKAVLLTSSHYVTVYALNRKGFSSDGFLVLPEIVLGELNLIKAVQTDTNITSQNTIPGCLIQALPRSGYVTAKTKRQDVALHRVKPKTFVKPSLIGLSNPCAMY